MNDGGMKPPCVWPEEWKDAAGCIPFQVFVQSLDYCQLDASDGGLCFSASLEISDRHGHLIDGDSDPLGADGCNHRNTPEWIAEHRKHERDSSMSQETISITHPPAPGPMTATVGVPDNAIEQVKSLIPADGNATGSTVLLALVGVAGGGAAFKLYQNFAKNNAEKSERSHELEMKRLELEHQSKQSDSHQTCAIERAQLEARVAALTGRLEEIAAKAEKTSASSLGDFDADDVEQRLAKIEKALKPAKRGRPPKEK